MEAVWESIRGPQRMLVSHGSLKGSDTTIENRQDILETLNEHFVTVGPNLARKIEGKQNDNPLQFLKRANPQESFKFTMVDQETMLKAIKQLKNGKAAGPDKNDDFQCIIEIRCLPRYLETWQKLVQFLRQLQRIIKTITGQFRCYLFFQN